MKQGNWGRYIWSSLVAMAMGSLSCYASGVESSLNISKSAILLQKERMRLIAENVANATTIKTASGLPYRRQIPIVRSNSDGTVRMVGVHKSTEPFRRVYDPANPFADAEGFISLPNVDLPKEMVDLSYTNVLYEANTTAYKSAKAMQQQMIDMLK